MHHRKFIIAALFLGLTIASKAQQLKLKCNTTEDEKLSSPIYKSFDKQYDLIIGYTTECYWWSDKRIYRLLAFKNGICLKGSFYSRRRKYDTWSKPHIKFEEVSKDSADYILSYLSNAGFFALNRDTLNINHRNINDKQDEVISVEDGVNYRFEILTGSTFTIIESYQPDYFLEKLPEFTSRAVFIKCQNLFIEKFNSL